ncbi:MAG: oligopeptide:H+ symporter [Francisella sp.]
MVSNKKTFSLPFWIIFFIELWERYGFAGIQVLLILFLINKLNIPETKSYILFGTFSAFIFGFIWIGGKVGDSILGAKRTIILGAIVLALSYISISLVDANTVYYSLAGIIIGNALFKANPASLISKMYKDDPDMLDSAITLYYMSINIGAFLSTLFTPFISQLFGYKVAFVTCGLSIFIGLSVFIAFYNKISHIATKAGKEKLNYNKLILTILATIVSIYGVAILIKNATISNIIVIITLILAVVYYFSEFKKENKESKIKMIIALLLFFEAITFFVLYNQMPSTLILFVQNNVDHSLFGYEISPAQYYIFNPLTIVIFSPILSKIYSKYHSTHATKFCMGMTFGAIAYLLLYIPQFISSTGIVSSWWVIATYVIQSIGELLISALGLSMMMSLCPKRISGFVSGFWYLATMISGPIAGWVGTLTVIDKKNISHIESIHVYGNIFGAIGLFTALVALFMWIMRPKINKFIES